MNAEAVECERTFDGSVKQEREREHMQESLDLVLVCSHYKEDLSWMRACDRYPIIVYECGVQRVPADIRALAHVEWREKPPLIDGIYSYLDYIVRAHAAAADALDDGASDDGAAAAASDADGEQQQHSSGGNKKLNRCAEYTLFLHGHDTSWHQRHSIARMLEQIEALHARSALPHYATVGTEVFRDWYEPIASPPYHWMFHTMQKQWHLMADVLPPDFPTVDEGICDVGAAQFVVHRSRLAGRSLAVWERARTLSLDARAHRHPAFYLEGMLHMLLGEPALRPFIYEHRERILRKHENELDLLLHMRNN